MEDCAYSKTQYHVYTLKRMKVASKHRDITDKQWQIIVGATKEKT